MIPPTKKKWRCRITIYDTFFLITSYDSVCYVYIIYTQKKNKEHNESRKVDVFQSFCRCVTA